MSLSLCLALSFRILMSGSFVETGSAWSRHGDKLSRHFAQSDCVFQCYYKMKDISKAEKAFERVLDLVLPRSAPPFFISVRSGRQQCLRAHRIGYAEIE